MTKQKEETLEEFRQRLHCSHASSDEVEEWYWLKKKEFEELEQQVIVAYQLLKVSLGKSFFDLEISPYAKVMLEFEKNVGIEGVDTRVPRLCKTMSEAKARPTEKEKAYFKEIEKMEAQAMKDAEEHSKQINEEKQCDIKDRLERENHEVFDISVTHPSLKGLESYHSKDGYDIRAVMCKNWYKEDDIQKHTRDVQIIEKAIKDSYYTGDRGTQEFDVKVLREELRLEEE